VGTLRSWSPKTQTKTQKVHGKYPFLPYYFPLNIFQARISPNPAWHFFVSPQVSHPRYNLRHNRRYKILQNIFIAVAFSPQNSSSRNPPQAKFHSNFPVQILEFHWKQNLSSLPRIIPFFSIDYSNSPIPISPQ
jgi:hypothetical protein